MQLAALVLAAAIQSGNLVIDVLNVGSGPAASEGDAVTIDYRGTLADGKEFDSSKGKAPITLTLGAKQVIPGWEEGVLGLRRGGKRKLTIPAAMAYGAKGIEKVIPPNATLTFEVELLYLVKK